MSFKSFKKIISIITIATFIVTNAVYATPDSKSIFKNKKVNYQKISDKNDGIMRQKKAVISGEDAKEAESQEKEAKKILSSHLEDISQIHIPQELGRITEVYNNADSKDKKPNLIVHIQDLHTNPEAELNLAKILELLLKDYSMALVCSEGADGKVDTSLVSSFPDSQAKEKVSRIFIDSGELTGEEYLSITKYPNLPIWGIEDEKIYFQNIADFNNIMNFKTSSQVFISQAKKALEQLKPKIYSKEMMSLDQKESDYENKKIETDAYLKYLNAYIQKFNLPTSDYKNISLLTETMVKEKAIDQLKIMKDYQNLFLNLQSTLQSRSLNNDLDSLIARANLFKDQKISPFSFYSYLKDLANKHLKEGFAAKYPELDSFVDYLTKVNLLDSTKLFVEMENLSYDIKTNLAKNAEEKTLASALKNIKFLESFFNLKVSNEELDYYLNNKDSHKVAFFEKFLKPAVAKYNISAVIDYNPDLIDKHFQELEDFYKVVKDRDVAMVNKAVSEIEKRNSKVSALIAGGFHTKGITKLLREKGYSYIVVSPYSKTDIDEENYHFLLSGKRKPLAEILSKLDAPGMLKRYVKTLRVPLMFNALAEKLEAYLGVDSHLAISIRDRLIAVLQIGFGGGSVELKKSAEGILVARYNPEKGSPQYYKITAEGIIAARPADFTGDTVYSETQHARAAEELIADIGRGSVWGALNTFARLGIKAGDEITVLGVQPERLKDAGKAWSESSVRREFKDAESLGIIVNTRTRDENGREVFKVLMSLTKKQLEALPANVITMLDKGRIIDEEIAGIAQAINDAVEKNEEPGEEQLRPILAELRNDRAITQLDVDVYGKPFEDVKVLNPKWAEAGFDKADKKEPSRFGWTLENLRWILRNPDKIQQVLDDAKEIRAKYKYVIFCGMGDSGLSVQTVKTTFGEPENLTIYSLRTTDPAVIKDILDNIARTEGSLEAALNYTLVIPISKSGKTEETVSHKKYFEDLFGKFQIDIKGHMWVVTDKGSPMDTGAYKQREIQFNGKGDIGGRFTAPTTNIFLLPLALVAPEKVEVILERARVMNEVDDIDNDTFIRLGAYLYHMAAEESKDKVTFIVPRELQDLPMWSEQLIEESLGKGGKGFTVFYGEDISEASIRDVGKNDRVFLRINIGGKKTNDELWKRLEEKGYPVFEINVDDIDSIGGIMLGLQRAVATVGYLWNICFVDQPAVEGYKNATREVMSKLQPGERVEVPRDWRSVSFGKLKLYYDRLMQVGAITEKELEIEVQRLGATMDDAAAVYAAIINILKAKPGFEAKELTSYGRMTEGMKGILQRARTSIFTDGLKMPSKFGEGPDKNHSYHQNIEAGKDMWLSTYFMPLQIEQPEALPYDDNLIRAQTIGTVNSIVKGGRKVALITFDSTTKDAEGDVDSFFKEVERYLKISTLVQSPKRQQATEMDQIIAVQAEAVKNDMAGFEKWVGTLPADNAVVIIAMDEGEYALVKQYEGYQDKVYIKTLADLKVDRLDLIELFGTYGTSGNFNGFKLGTPATIEKYKTVARAIAEGV